VDAVVGGETITSVLAVDERLIELNAVHEDIDVLIDVLCGKKVEKKLEPITHSETRCHYGIADVSGALEAPFAICPSVRRVLSDCVEVGSVLEELGPPPELVVPSRAPEVSDVSPEKVAELFVVARHVARDGEAVTVLASVAALILDPKIRVEIIDHAFVPKILLGLLDQDFLRIRIELFFREVVEISKGCEGKKEE
jgi:hypothetical protein